MNAKHLITALAAATVLLATDANAQKFPPTSDTAKPTLSLRMNDGKKAGPIILYEPGVFPRDDLPLGVTMSLGSLGCDGTFSEQTWSPGWTGFYGYHFREKEIQDQTYFFQEADVTTPYSGPFRFTLRANDNDAVKRILIRITERGVVADSSDIYDVSDDGPTEFFDVSPSRAIPQFEVLPSASGLFANYEKRLLLEPYRRLDGKDHVLKFSLLYLGLSAQIRVEVEDFHGNITEGSVYLASDFLCK